MGTGTRLKCLASFMIFAATLKLSHGAGYVGCHRDVNRKRVLAHNPGGINPAELTPSKCQTTCGILKYTYAGVDGGSACFCGNTLDQLILVDDNNCSIPCTGDPGLFCGGRRHISVYTTVVTYNIRVAAANKHVVAGTTVSFDVTPDTAAPGFNVRADFDDGAGLSEYSTSVAGLTTRTYHQAGEYNVGMFISSLDLSQQDVDCRTSVTVQSAVNGLTLTCPDVAASFVMSTCIVEVVRGSQMEITYNYPDGTNGPMVGPASFMIGDAPEYMLGNPVQEKLTIGTAVQNGLTTGQVVYSGRPAEHSGKLIGFEYFAVNAGNLNVRIFEAVCGGALEYCPTNNLCVTPGSCCMPCPVAEACMDSETCTDQAFSKTEGLQAPTYSEIFMATIPALAGYGYYSIDTMPDIPAGAVLSHETNNPPILGLIPLAAGSPVVEGLTSLAAGVGFTPADCVDQQTAHQLKAIYSGLARAKVPLVFTGTGLVTVSMSVSNTHPSTGPNTLTLTDDVMVYEGVNKCVPYVEEPCLAVDEVGFIFVEPFSGNGVTVSLDYGDGFTENVQLPNALTMFGHTYNTIGHFPVSINISNFISWQYNQTTVCTMERLSGLSLTFPLGSIASTGDTLATLDMSSGSNYTCSFFITHPEGHHQTINVDEDLVPNGGTQLFSFHSAGDAVIVTACSNAISSETHTANIRVVEPMTNVGMRPPGAVANVAFNMLLGWDTGTDVQFDYFNFNGIPLPMTIDNSFSKTATALEERIETTTGLIPVSYQISNPLGTYENLNDLFVIEVEITRPNLTCVFEDDMAVPDMKAIGVNTGVTCYIDMEAGTSVNVTVDFGDGQAPYTYQFGLGANWNVAETALPLYNLYTVPNRYNLVMSVRNNFNARVKSYDVRVLVPLNFVEPDPVSPQLHTPPAFFEFTFHVTEGQHPMIADISVKWGDGLTDTYIDQDLTQPLQHSYLLVPGDSGYVDITFAMSNLISSKTIPLQVQIVTPIVNSVCFSDPIASTPGAPVWIVWMADRAPGIGGVTLDFKYNDPAVPGKSGSLLRTAVSPYGQDRYQWTYANRGNYSVTVVADSPLECITCPPYIVEVMHPVTEEFNVITNHPMDWHVAVDRCKLSMIIVYTGLPLPDRASIDIDYGDGSVNETNIPFTTSLPRSHQYTTHGHYKTTIRIYNKASSVTRVVLTGCYQKFTTFTMEVKRQSILPANSPFQPGYGVAENKYRSDQYMIALPVLEQGTFVEWNVVAASPLNTYTYVSEVESPVAFVVPEPGNYTLTVRAENPLYTSTSQTYDFEIMKPVKGPIISPLSRKSIPAYAFMPVDILFEMYGTAMCVAVDSGEPKELFTYSFGDLATCEEKPTIPGFRSTTYQYDPFVEVGGPFNFSTQYFLEGQYTIRLFAWNAFSDASTTFEFPVSSIDCSAPNIDIVDFVRNPNYPNIYLESLMIKIIGLTDIQCPDTLNNTKWWTVTPWDAATNAAVGGNLDLYDVNTRVNSELSFPAQYFFGEGRGYGLYKATYKVTMVTPSKNGAQFFGTGYTFFYVDKTPIVMAIFDNSVSLKTIGRGNILTLDLQVASYDPDSVNKIPQQFDRFELGCRDVTLGEDWSTCTETIQAMNATSLPAGWVSTGGCFQMGCGWIAPFDQSLTINTDIFTVDHTYEFYAKGYLDSRVGENRARIQVVSGDPPQVSISSRIKSSIAADPEGIRFNKNSQIGLLASIANMCTDGCTYTYQWQFCAVDHNFCMLNEDCLNCLDTYSQFIKGLKTNEMTVLPGLFGVIPSNTFKAKLSVASSNDISSVGLAVINMIENLPPSGGNCSITPDMGLALVDNFTIQCDYFTDDEGSVDWYEVTCRTGGKVYPIAGGSTNYWSGKRLPSGDPSNGYILNCFVEVTDNAGASAEYPIHDVTIHTVSPSDFKDLFAEIRASKNSTYNLNDATANLADSCSLGASTASILQDVADSDEFVVYSGDGTALDIKPTSLADEVRVNAFKATKNAAAVEQFEKERADTAAVNELFFGTLEICTRESAHDVTTLLTTLENLCSVFAYLSRVNQEKVISLMEVDIAKMKRIEQTLTVESARAIALKIVTICSDVREAASLGIVNPMMLDVDRIDPAELSTNMDTSLPELPSLQEVNSTEDLIQLAQLGMNKDNQNKTAMKIMESCYRMEQKTLTMLFNKLPVSEDPEILDSSNVIMHSYKNYGSELKNRTFTLAGMDFDATKNILPHTLDDKVVILILMARSSPGVQSSEAETSASGSRSLSARYMYPNGTEIKVDNVPDPMLVKVKRDPNLAPFDWSTVNFTEPRIEDNDAFFYQKFESKLPRAAFKLKFIFNETKRDYQLMVLFSYASPPVLGPSSNVEHVCLLPRHTSYFDGAVLAPEDEMDPFSCFLDADLVNGRKAEKWRFAVREADTLDYYTKVSRLPPAIPEAWINDTISVSYKLLINEVNCPYTEAGGSTYKYDKAKPHWSSTEYVLYCETNHLTSFAGGWIVAPNAIDFNHVFANADFLSNPTLYITEMVIVLGYILAMIWARRKDKQDVTKLGLAPLLDNDPRDKYYYEVFVETGMRRNAGTESKVHFILSGEEEETEVRTFTDKKRKIFQRTNTDGFLMAVPSPLGALMYLRLWHDNSGKGPMGSWYLNHIVIRDIQTEKKYFFICNRWFAVEEDDGQVDRVIPVAGKEQMTEFSHMFKERAQKNLSDGHLWFSVVARPPQSRFTRCQRVSCCVSLLFTTMLANAMFYTTETSDSSAYTFGPFAVTPEQIFIGIACNLIIFPVNFLLITIFRKSRPRKLRPSRVEEALKSVPERSASVTDLNVRVSSSMSMTRPGSSLFLDANSGSRPYSAMSMQQTQPPGTGKSDKKKKSCELPWGFVIVGWILLWATVLTSAFFVTMYGIQFGDMKCKKWITSMMISFFTSVFLTQPIKVFLFAIIFSLVIKNPGGNDDEDTDEEERKPTSDEELLHTEADGYGVIAPKKALYKPKPPNTKSLELARKQRLKEIQMWSVIREILFYAFFLMILLVISYRNVSSNSYRYKNNMERVFIYTNDTSHEFSKIKNVRDYWSWARTGMLRGLRAGPYYNNWPPFYLRGYINDKASRLMGYAVLRQVRVKPGSCTVAKQMRGVIDECNEEYDRSTDDTRTFGVGWSNNLTGSREEYQYQDASTLKGYPYVGVMAVYSGGGYIVRLNKDYNDMVADFVQLEKERWIDEYTRAVFLEFTVYNPSVNMFSVSNLLAEFRPSGGVFPSYRFEPCMLLPYMNSVLLFQIACEIVYFAFTLYFVIKELRNIYKQKSQYFKDFWNLLEFCIAAMSVTAIVIYFYRMICINELTEYFKETKGNEYMKFQYVGYWTEIFMYIIGFLIFFATLKFLKLLRFNKKISLLTSVLSNSGRDLLHFSVIFNIVFMAFIQFFYLLYHAHLDIFKTLISSTNAGIVMMMGKFDIYKMIAVNSWLTQIFIFLFVLTITFIVVNMFLSILNETFGAVREDISKQQNDYEIVEFMINRFKLWTGLGRGKSTTISPEKLERKRQKEEVKAKIDALPDQIDRFLASVSAMYLEKSKFDTQMDKDIYSKMALKVQQYDGTYPQPYNPHPAPRNHGGQRLWAGSQGMTDID